MEIGISIVVSVITAAITAKVSATHYFKIVDSYVEDMCDLTNRSNESTLDAVRKLEQYLLSKECKEGRSNESTLAIIRRPEHVFETDRDMDIERFVEEFIKS